MSNKKISLTAQIKKVIGNRVLFCSIAYMLIIIGLTFYDLTISVTQLRSRINEQIKPIEEFAINQAIINNLDTIELKIESFNENNPTLHIEWVRQGEPQHSAITWRFPFSWVYDYRIGQIIGYQFGYFKVTGGFLSDKTLIYDLLFRLSLLVLFAISILSILYPLANKIPEQLFINPINRFIDLVLHNSVEDNLISKSLPVELEMLETKILSLLNTATEHERNKAAIEIGHLTARLAHDIYSPLAAMEMGLHLLTKRVPQQELAILANGIQSVRDIANNVLERYRKPNVETSSSILTMRDDGNVVRPILLSNVVDFIISQKRHEWYQRPCKISFTVMPDAKISWITVAPNEVKRLLSNLLNNAYDALINREAGVIDVALSKNDGELHLQLRDNGIGIPSEKITDVLNGASLKHAGKGLGLSGAKRYMDNLEGRLEINSVFGTGTQINLIFPRIDNHSWFPEYTSLNNATTVVVLDDDISMLAYWEQRIRDAGLVPKQFSEYDKAVEWTEANKDLISSTVFIADYELTDNFNGLTFLENIENNKNRYLITSHAEELECQNSAAKAGVWLVPKSLVCELSFNESNNNITIVSP